MSLRVGRIIGIPVRLHYTWFLAIIFIAWTLAVGYMPLQYPRLPAYLYWVIGIVSALLLFISVLLHELCHSYFAKKYGLPVDSIMLFLFGGVAQMIDDPQNPDVEFKMAAAGPVCSFALALLFGGAWFISNQVGLGIAVTATLQYAGLTNILLGGFNLAPAFPLDGGRMLRARIWKSTGNILRATNIASSVGVGFSYLLMFGGFAAIILGSWISGLWVIFIGWFLKNGAESSQKHTLITEALAGLNIRDVMSAEVHTVDADTSVKDMVQHFLRYKHSGFPVVEGENKLGVVTLHDIRKVHDRDLETVRARDIMTPWEKMIKIGPNEPVSNAMIKMSQNNIGRLPVVDDSRLIGIVTRSDVMRIITLATELGRKISS